GHRPVAVRNRRVRQRVLETDEAQRHNAPDRWLMTTADADLPDPARVVTRRDFARELTLLKDGAGLTVRQIAAAVRMPASTVGGYFSGAHLPAVRPPDLLDNIVRTSGEHEPAVLDAWRRALRRARRATGELASP